MKYKKFKNEFYGHCRNCINEKLEVIHLTHQDCEYWEFPEPCACCGQVKNIVTGLRLISRIKLLKVKDKEDQA